MPILTSGMPNTAFARDPEIAGTGEFEPGAERITVDPGDDRDGESAERVTALMHQGDEAARTRVVEGGDLGDVGAADKSALAGAAHHHEPQPRVSREPGDGLDDLSHQSPVQAVQLAGVIDRQMRDAAPFGAFLTANQDTHWTKSPAIPRE